MLKERLLNKISPDDACPLGVQLSLDTTGNIFQSGLKDYKHSDMVDIPLFTIDDDIPTSGLGSQANAGGQEFSDNLILLSVDDILGSNPSMMNRLKSRVASVRKPQASVTIEEHTTNSSDTQQVLPIRLSSHQITLLLSSIWVQSVYPLNTLENFEAIAHTYNLVLLVARNKNSSDDALIQSFQLAFSLRSISLNEKVKLLPSRRRSLFTLATSMIIFTSKAYNILSLISIAKMALTDKTVDPFLQLVNDSKLQAVVDTSWKPSKVYGSNEDDEDALNALSSIKLTESQSNESCATMIVQSLEKPADLNKFSPDDACPLGVQLSLDTTGNAYQSGLKDDKHSDMVLETTNHVGRISVSTPCNMQYKEMALHCENLLKGKQQKISTFMSTRSLYGTSFRIPAPEYNNNKDESTNSNIQQSLPLSGNPFLDTNISSTSPGTLPETGPRLCATEYQHQAAFFHLPASRP
ncbi:unnamed protein product [Trifolium pratense]|uniref:Uncharacterized protein n=1 Tax=Trifolium pratense TaxID=57577 RepID=A0ACB0IVR2_TRIPR|nr:unnamed protein product [Trifolium pratense]